MHPDTFEDALQQRLGSDYRLRWSDSRHVWMIEQRAGREEDIPSDALIRSDLNDVERERRLRETRDQMIRLRDGFTLVMEFNPTTQVDCPQCHFPITLPTLKIAQVRCETCELLGYDRQFVQGGWFPLCDSLIATLERTSLKRHDAWRTELATKNAALAIARRRNFDNHCEAVGKDYFNQAVGIEQFGYTAPNTPHSYGV